MNYYYTLPDGSIGGPVPLIEIKAGMRNGSIAADAKLTQGGDAPWGTFDDLFPSEKAARPEAQVSSGNLPADPVKNSVAGAVEVIAWISIAAGILFAVIGFTEMAEGKGDPIFFIAGISGLFWGVMILAVSEAIKLLARIEKNTRR